MNYIGTFDRQHIVKIYIYDKICSCMKKMINPCHSEMVLLPYWNRNHRSGPESRKPLKYKFNY